MLKYSWNGGYWTRDWADDPESNPSRDFIAQITPGNPFPLQLPPAKAEPVTPPTVEAVLARAGFAPHQYRLAGERYWAQYSEASYEPYGDPLEGDGYVSGSKRAWLVRENDHGVWDLAAKVHADGDGRNLLEPKWLSVSPMETACAKAPLVEMGMSEEDVSALKARIDKEFGDKLEAAKAALAKSHQEFWRRLASLPAFGCLPEDMIRAVSNKVGGVLSIRYSPLPSQEELEEVWPIAEALHHLREAGEILVNFGGHFRVMGKTRNDQRWVVTPDGQLRPPDVSYLRKRYEAEGEQVWRVVRPEDMALRWSKAFSRAPHAFEVCRMPRGGQPTAEQLATVTRLEGWAESRSRPDIGNGWELASHEASEESPDEQFSDMESALEALRKKFGKD